MKNGPIYAVIAGPTLKAYFFRKYHYHRFDWETNAADKGYPRSINVWSWPSVFSGSIDSAFNGVGAYAGKAYFCKGNQYVRFDWENDVLDDGFPQPLSSWNLPAPFSAGIDAVVNGAGSYAGKAYFFKGSQYLRYDWASNSIDKGYPQPISAWNFPSSFSSGIDAALDGMGEQAGKAYFFRGDEYIRYDWATDRVDEGFPLPLQGHWPGLIEQFAIGTSVANGVVYEDFVLEGGTLAWRNHNPGNLKPGKLPYNSAIAVDGAGLAIFSNYNEGWEALRVLLRGRMYGPKTIPTAIRTYAPTGDGGNDPAKYAEGIRSETGLDPSRTLDSLTDEELDKVMLAIQKIEGSKEGKYWHVSDLSMPQVYRDIIGASS